MKSGIRLALCQLTVSQDKDSNIENAVKMLEKAAGNGADIAVLPEMFNCPYDGRLFEEFSENIVQGRTVMAISEISREFGIYVVAGSIPEKLDGKIYNTSIAFDRNGSIAGIHRKMHLFDVDIPGKIRFMESDALTAGDSVTVFDTEFCKVGIAICYDMRFPELIRLMSLKGAKLIIVPAAFNMTTGPAHWELLIRTRALDNQVFFAGASPARDENAHYIAYGHSMVASPWGEIVASADEREQIVYADIGLEQVDTIRKELPLLKRMKQIFMKQID